MRAEASTRELIPAAALLDPRNLDDPYPFYARLRAAAPVWQVPGTEVFVVTRYSLLEEAARRVEDFSSNLQGVLYRSRDGSPGRLMRRGLPQTLATADPPAHSLHKKVVFPELVAKRMAAMAADVEQVGGTCIDELLRTGGGDFMATVANPVPITVISKLIGFKEPDIDKLLRAAFDSTAIVGATQTRFQLGLLMIRTLLVFRWLSGQLRTAEPSGDNILGALKRSVEAGNLRSIEANAILHTLLAAGGESTTSLLGNAVRVLARNPALQEQLRAQPDLVPAFVEEVLRVESPFRHHLRSTPRATSLGGVDIPAGATVLMFWAAGNRDPDAFKNPDEIDLTRPRGHMTFGRGIHTCVGAPLARLEGLIVLRSLLARTRHIALDPARAPRYVESLQVRRYEQLPIVVTPA